MSLNTADKIFLMVGLIGFGGGIVWIGIMLYLASTKMDEMLEHLKNSPTIITLASLRHTGPWGKLMLIGGISGFLAFPRGYLKRGCISTEDIENFPEPLKRKLTRLHCIGLVLALIIIGVGVVAMLDVV